MIRGEISEYPFTCVIKRTIEGVRQDTEETIYEGVADLHMVTSEIGRTLQTSDYIVSIPFSYSSKFVMPKKGDDIVVTRYGEDISLEINNVEPSQLDGISIYAARKTW